MGHKRSSSSSSGSLSSSNYSSHTRHHKSSKSKRNRSRSSSRSKKDREYRRQESSRDRYSRRKRHSSSSSYSSRSRSRSRSRNKKSKKSKKSRRRSSSSQEKMTSDKYSASISNMEREKDFDFKDSLDDLYRSEQGRKYTTEKLDKNDPGDGFKPQSFKSSRSNKTSSKSSGTKSIIEQDHDSAIFGLKRGQIGTGTESKQYEQVNRFENVQLSAQIEVNIVSTSSKSLMHESLFEDILIKEKRWKKKMLELIPNS